MASASEYAKQPHTGSGNLWVRLTVLSLGIVMSAISGSAQSQITLGQSTQNVVFQSTSSSSMNLAFGSCNGTTFTGTCTLSGSAFFDAGDTASYSFTTTTSSSYTAANDPSGIYPITNPAGATSVFSYSSNDNDKMTGTVTWIDVFGSGSNHATIEGLITITSSSGDAAFLAAFATGSTMTADLTLTTTSLQCNPSISPCTLGNLFNNVGTTASQPISSGNVSPNSVVPEPNTMLLLGTGLMGLGGAMRYRKARR